VTSLNQAAAQLPGQPRRRATNQTLLIDADDTLWENNIYFERAFDEFCEFLSHSNLTPVEVRAVLDEIEVVNAKVHGYGSENFGRNMAQCYQHLAECEIREDDLRTVMAFATRILDTTMPAACTQYKPQGCGCSWPT